MAARPNVYFLLLLCMATVRFTFSQEAELTQQASCPDIGTREQRISDLEAQLADAQGELTKAKTKQEDLAACQQESNALQQQVADEVRKSTAEVARVLEELQEERARATKLEAERLRTEQMIQEAQEQLRSVLEAAKVQEEKIKVTESRLSEMESSWLPLWLSRCVESVARYLSALSSSWWDFIFNSPLGKGAHDCMMAACHWSKAALKDLEPHMAALKEKWNSLPVVSEVRPRIRKIEEEIKAVIGRSLKGMPLLASYDDPVVVQFLAYLCMFAPVAVALPFVAWLGSKTFGRDIKGAKSGPGKKLPHGQAHQTSKGNPRKGHKK